MEKRSLVIRLLAVGLLLFCLFILGCSFDFEKSVDVEIDPSVSRHYLALLKAQENHRLDMEQIINLVKSALPASFTTGRSVIGPSLEVRQLPINHALRFNSRELGRSLATENQVDVYKLTVGDAAFVLASNDIRVGPILAIAEGSLDAAPPGFTDVLMVGIENYIDAIIAEYNNITVQEVEQALEKALSNVESRVLSGNTLGTGWTLNSQNTDFRIQRAPLLMTNWGQGSTGAFRSSGHAYNNYIRHRHNNDQFIAGCGPVAIAKIVAHHNHINVASGFNTLGTHRPRPFDSPTLGRWSGTYDLSQIRRMDIITNTCPPEARGQVAALMFQIGILAGAQYTNGFTNMYMSRARTAFNRLGYDVLLYNSNATTLSGSSSDFSIRYRVSLATIRNAISNNRPILMRGASRGGKGHFWVIDGYGSMTFVQNFYQHTTTGQRISRTLRVNNVLMVHCNLGWNGNANGWYIYGIFDTQNPVFNSSRSSIKEGDRNYSSGTMLLIAAPARGR